MNYEVEVTQYPEPDIKKTKEVGKYYLHNSIKPFIIMCSDHPSKKGLFSGVVIEDKACDYKAGHFSDEWLSTEFVPFEGTITIKSVK